MIQQSKPHIRKLFVALLVVSMFLCPLAHGGFMRISSAEGERQIYPTVPPVDPTIPMPLGTLISESTPIPILGVGSYFDEGDANEPQVINIEEGDERFGYGPIEGNEELYAIWVTDGAGTHYLIVHKDSTLLRGDIDGVTEERIENGFDHQLDEWRRISSDIDLKQEEVNIQQESRMSSHGAALGVAVIGGLICVVVTGGACLVTVGLASLVPWGKGVYHNGLRNAELDNLETLQENLEIEENRLLGKFSFGQAYEGTTENPIEKREEE